MYNLLLFLSKAADSATGKASEEASKVFSSAQGPIVELVNAAVTPLIMIVSAIAAIYAILLGAKLAKAEEPQEREKAKQALKNAIVGFVLIFVLLVILRTTATPLAEWAQKYAS